MAFSLFQPVARLTFSRLLHPGFRRTIVNRMGGETVTGVMLPNTEQFYLDNKQGEQYLIQVSWPLHWRQGDSGREGLPIIYIVDGNALFLTATEAAWRRAAESHYSGGGMVVAIGYPLTGKLYSRDRRNFDLTPPTPQPINGFGGSDLFLDFIETVVRPAVRARHPDISFGREALFGHSYGGLFALHALFTRPHLFDGYFASSPSIWWNYKYILDEAREFVRAKCTREHPGPALTMFVGALEQDPCRWYDESPEQFEKRKRDALLFNMKENATGLLELLREGTQVRTVALNEYPGEDHGTVMACSMSRSLTTFFEEWPLPN